jgi:hypothetical protein
MPGQSALLAIALVCSTLISDLARSQTITGPSTRRSSLVLSETHYHPAGDTDPSAEFIELYNSSPTSVNLQI